MNTNQEQEHPVAKASKYPKNIPPEKQIFLALPCYGGQMTQPFVMSLIETLQTAPFVGTIDFVVNDSLVSRARNTLAARFLASSYNWMLFLDVDLQFKPEHIARLWIHATQKERKIICGIYAMKKLTPRFVANWIPGEVPDEHGAVKVSESGTGCMLIHRSVFEKMRADLPQIEYTTDSNHVSGGGMKEWDFFGVGPYRYKDGLVRYLSEDWMFCQRARDIGFDVWADTNIQIRHMGTMVYPPEASEVADAMRAYRAMGAAGCPTTPI